MIHGGVARVRDFGGVGVGRYWLSALDHNKKIRLQAYWWNRPGTVRRILCRATSCINRATGAGETKCDAHVSFVRTARTAIVVVVMVFTKFGGSRGKKYKLQVIRLRDKRIQVRINTIVLPEREKQRRLPDAANNTTRAARSRQQPLFGTVGTTVLFRRSLIVYDVFNTYKYEVWINVSCVCYGTRSEAP